MLFLVQMWVKKYRFGRKIPEFVACVGCVCFVLLYGRFSFFLKNFTISKFICNFAREKINLLLYNNYKIIIL